VAVAILEGRLPVTQEIIRIKLATEHNEMNTANENVRQRKKKGFCDRF